MMTEGTPTSNRSNELISYKKGRNYWFDDQIYEISYVQNLWALRFPAKSPGLVYESNESISGFLMKCTS